MNRQIISYNMAGWNWRISTEKWEDRVRRSCEYIINKMSEPMVIGLQEVQLSGGKYLKVLEEYFPEYHIILPPAFNGQPRSVISILLLRKDICDSYSVNVLDNLEDSLRYNYVTFNTSDGLCFRVLNTNIPHTCYDDKAEWFQEDRRILREKFIKAIEIMADIYKNEQDVKFIALGDFNTVPEDPFINGLAYTYVNRPMIDAVEKEDKNKITWLNQDSQNRLDYIFYSRGMLNDTGLSAKFTQIDDSSIINQMSDHAILFGGVVY